MFQILNPDEVHTVGKAGIDVQLHTHRHRTPRERSLFVREIEENRNHIRAMTGREPVHFCYPSGNYEPEFFSWLKACGVRSATTCDTGLAVAGSDSLRLPRVLDINSLYPVRFESIVAGFLV
jgi:peptidoglycan/xylan/chitin deacetylase (PgdA/CDA1 family)